MSNIPEDLDKALFSLADYGWKEQSFCYYDGNIEVVLKKGKDKIRINYDVCD